MPRLTKRSASSQNTVDSPTTPNIPTTPTTETSSSSDDLPSFLTSPVPKLIVFDLDYTLWPFWIDTHVTAPLKPAPNNSSSSSTSNIVTAALDKHAELYTFYDDVPSILQTLSRCTSPPIRLAIASRTCAPALAKQLLKMLGLPALPPTEHLSKLPAKTKAIDVFDAGLEIYPSSKVKHFEAIHKRTGIAYEDMLFFDDEARNRDTEALGVTMWLVRDGVSWKEIERGVGEWRRRRGFTEKK